MSACRRVGGPACRQRFEFPALLTYRRLGLVDVRRSGGVAVFVDEAAEAVGPLDLSNAAGSGRRSGCW